MKSESEIKEFYDNLKTVLDYCDSDDGRDVAAAMGNLMMATHYHLMRWILCEGNEGAIVVDSVKQYASEIRARN